LHRVLLARGHASALPAHATGAQRTGTRQPPLITPHAHAAAWKQVARAVRCTRPDLTQRRRLPTCTWRAQVSARARSAESTTHTPNLGAATCASTTCALPDAPRHPMGSIHIAASPAPTGRAAGQCQVRHNNHTPVPPLAGVRRHVPPYACVLACHHRRRRRRQTTQARAKHRARACAGAWPTPATHRGGAAPSRAWACATPYQPAPATHHTPEVCCSMYSQSMTTRMYLGKGQVQMPATPSSGGCDPGYTPKFRPVHVSHHVPIPFLPSTLLLNPRSSFPTLLLFHSTESVPCLVQTTHVRTDIRTTGTLSTPTKEQPLIRGS